MVAWVQQAALESHRLFGFRLCLLLSLCLSFLHHGWHALPDTVRTISLCIAKVVHPRWHCSFFVGITSQSMLGMMLGGCLVVEGGGCLG